MRALAAISISALLAACASEAQPIDVTFVTATSGDLAGDNFDNGVLLALEEINAAGGVGGRPVTLTTLDDGSTPEGTAQAYSAALLAGTPVIIGPTHSQGVVEVADQIRDGNTLTVAGSTTSPFLSTIDFGGAFFRTCPSDAVQGVVLADLIRDAGLTHVCIVHRADAYGDGLAQVITASLGSDVAVAATSYQPSAPSLAEVLEDCEETRLAEAPGIVFITYEVDGLTLLDDAAVRGWDARVQKVFLVDANRSQLLLDGLADPAAIEGAIGTAPSGPDPATPAGIRYRTFRNSFQFAYGEAPDALTENIYDAVYIGLAAVVASGSPDDHEAIIEAVGALQQGTPAQVGDWASIERAIEADGEVDLQGASGEIDLDIETGELLPPYYIQIWGVTNGEISIDRVVDVGEASPR
jgi:ABC-type branched-subunit amino acid transport system substrate-binding protein